MTLLAQGLHQSAQRNKMIHEYVRDSAELAEALCVAHDAVPMLGQAAQAMSALVLGDSSVEPARAADQRTGG